MSGRYLMHSLNDVHASFLHNRYCFLYTIQCSVFSVNNDASSVGRISRSITLQRIPQVEQLYPHCMVASGSSCCEKVQRRHRMVEKEAEGGALSSQQPAPCREALGRFQSMLFALPNPFPPRADSSGSLPTVSLTPLSTPPPAPLPILESWTRTVPLTFCFCTMIDC